MKWKPQSEAAVLGVGAVLAQPASIATVGTTQRTERFHIAHLTARFRAPFAIWRENISVSLIENITFLGATDPARTECSHGDLRPTDTGASAPRSRIRWAKVPHANILFARGQPRPRKVMFSVNEIEIFSRQIWVGVGVDVP